MDKSQGLKMRKFTVRVVVVPTNLDLMLGATIKEEIREIEGYTLKDAKKRAGIK